VADRWSLRRDTTLLPAIAFDSSFLAGVQQASNSLFASVREFFRDIGLDLSGMRQFGGVYRPLWEFAAASIPAWRAFRANLNIILAAPRLSLEALFPTQPDSSSRRNTRHGTQNSVRCVAAFFQYHNFLGRNTSESRALRCQYHVSVRDSLSFVN
jgi:hypothetical protein